MIMTVGPLHAVGHWVGLVLISSLIHECVFLILFVDLCYLCLIARPCHADFCHSNFTPHGKMSIISLLTPWGKKLFIGLFPWGVIPPLV